jgi:hypothetical protein
VTNKQIEELAAQAGFLRIRLKGQSRLIFSRGTNTLRVTEGSMWGFYGSDGKTPEQSGTDHGSLAEFLNAQIAKGS